MPQQDEIIQAQEDVTQEKSILYCPEIMDDTYDYDGEIFIAIVLESSSVEDEDYIKELIERDSLWLSNIWDCD